MRYRTISRLGSFTKFSLADAPDYFALRPSACSGGGGPAQRNTEENAPGQDGVLIFPPVDGAWVLTLAGELVVTSTGLSSEPGYREAIDVLHDELEAAVEALGDAPDALVHAGGTLQVWQHGEFDETWDDMETICAVTFSVIVDVFA